MPGEPPAEAGQLIAAARAKIVEALNVIRTTSDEVLFEARAVGRAQLPTNVFGLLFHIAEHTQRHSGPSSRLPEQCAGLKIDSPPEIHQ